MKTKLSKSQAEQKIKDFFERSKFTSEEVKKTKRLVMKFNIKLKEYRKKFCKSCLSQLKGKTRITKTHKTIECEKCGYNNRFKMN
ncbi:MAG: hypothetical protein AABY22_04135 [Nanoarchaeota archaeon]